MEKKKERKKQIILTFLLGVGPLSPDTQNFETQNTCIYTRRMKPLLVSKRSKRDSLSMKMEYYNIHVCERILEKGPYGEKIAIEFYNI